MSISRVLVAILLVGVLALSGCKDSSNWFHPGDPSHYPK
jgi:hypothetical protein